MTSTLVFPVPAGRREERRGKDGERKEWGVGMQLWENPGVASVPMVVPSAGVNPA